MQLQVSLDKVRQECDDLVVEARQQASIRSPLPQCAAPSPHTHTHTHTPPPPPLLLFVLGGLFPNHAEFHLLWGLLCFHFIGSNNVLLYQGLLMVTMTCLPVPAAMHPLQGWTILLACCALQPKKKSLSFVEYTDCLSLGGTLVPLRDETSTRCSLVHQDVQASYSSISRAQARVLHNRVVWWTSW